MLYLVVLALLSVWACVQNLIYMNYLPERVAIHFGPDGTPDNWMDRGNATLLMIALQAILPWMLVGIAQLVRYLPISAVNIPNREYWLQPARREASLAYLARFIAIIGIAESIFISILNHLSFEANRTAQPLNTSLLMLFLFLFLMAVLVMVIGLYRRFSLPKGSHAQA